MKKRRVLITILVVFMMALSLGGVYVNAAEPFKINLYVASQTHDTYEVHAEITNNGADFTGTLRIMVTSQNYTTVGYDVDISIPAGSTKEYKLTLPRDFVSPTENVRAVIYDGSMHKKYTEKFKSIFSGFSDIISIGTLSDNPGDLSFLDMSGNKIEANGNKYSIKLRTTNVDDLVDDLGSLSILVIDDYDTSVLGNDKINSIASWVADGGMLILGTGGEAERVLSGFMGNNDISVTASGGEMGSIILDYDSSYVSGPYMKANIFCGDGFYMGNTEDQIKTLGYGAIVIAPIKLGDMKDNHNDASEVGTGFIRDAMMARTGGSYSTGSNLGQYEIKNIESYMEKPANTGKTALIIIFILYVILVGPVIYLILKAINKREKIWIVIPAISLLFMVFVFLVSFSVKVKGLTLKSVSIVDIDTGKENAYLIGYQPDPKEWTVKTVNDKYLSGTVLSESYLMSNEDCSGSIKKSGNLYLTSYPSNTFALTTFLVNKVSDEKVGGFDVNAGLDANNIDYGSTDYDASVIGALNGKIINNTGVNFDYVIFAVGNNYQLVEGLASGESFDINLASSQSVGYYGDMVEVLSGPAYKSKDYDKSSELAALSLAYSSYTRNSTGAAVFGVVKSDSITDSKDEAYKCYYSNINSLLY